jgi:S-adenosylmethionine hydrolase
MKTITLLTDFGLKDGYVGVMKGVIWSLAPEAQIADLTHLIGPQNVMEGALALGRAAPYFPAGTVHVGVVDPGVGTQRRPIAGRFGEHFFVGPDNGLCTVLVQWARQAGQLLHIVHLDQPRYWLPEISHVFHGRDIFAPVAAHLANGVPLNELGTPIDDLVLLDLPVPQRIDQGWRGQVIVVDNFGNLSTNLEREHLVQLGGEWNRLKVGIAGRQVHGVIRTFGDAPPGQLVALFGEAHDLSICIVNGNAAAALGVGVGAVVEVSAE